MVVVVVHTLGRIIAPVLQRARALKGGTRTKVPSVLRARSSEHRRACVLVRIVRNVRAFLRNLYFIRGERKRTLDGLRSPGIIRNAIENRRRVTGRRTIVSNGHFFAYTRSFVLNTVADPNTLAYVHFRRPFLKERRCIVIRFDGQSVLYIDTGAP